MKKIKYISIIELNSNSYLKKLHPYQKLLNFHFVNFAHSTILNKHRHFNDIQNSVIDDLELVFVTLILLDPHEINDTFIVHLSEASSGRRPLGRLSS